MGRLREEQPFARMSARAPTRRGPAREALPCAHERAEWKKHARHRPGCTAAREEARAEKRCARERACRQLALESRGPPTATLVASGEALRSDERGHPRPPRPVKALGAQVAPLAPRLGFPPWNPPSEAPPNSRNPQGGKPIPPAALCSRWSLRLGPLGGCAWPKGPGPLTSRPVHASRCARRSPPAPSAPAGGSPRATDA